MQIHACWFHIVYCSLRQKRKHSNDKKSYLSESVEEGLGKAFASSSLCERILATKDLGLVLLNVEAHAQLRDIDFSTMVKASIKTFQH